ncbi:MAG: potassium-transporting ATPase subunit KdpA [Erysipelotrichaceae bacterium]
MYIALFFVVYLILVIPMGRYLYLVMGNKKYHGSRFFDKFDNFIFRLMKIDPHLEMNWKQYAIAFVVSNLVIMVGGYLVLVLQSYLFLNPNGASNMSLDLAFNTVISFMTNTNLQHYVGETSLSYFSTMSVIIFMMFVSSAGGYSVCAAFIRGICGKPLGNYYLDMVKIITRVLVPFSLFIGVLLIAFSTPQTLSPNVVVDSLDKGQQLIHLGPIASLEAIKHLGTNGGGFFLANSASPLENPNVFTNIIQMYSMMLLPGACVVMFGHYVNEVRNDFKSKLFGSEGRVIFLSMAIMFAIGLMVIYFAELNGNPVLGNTGVLNSFGNLEGKELRFGILDSSLFSSITTSFTTGSVNNMHDSLMPLGGLMTMLNMMLNVVFGGKGVGLMNMIIYVMLGVFICNLMIGKTPQYLNRKIEGKEMKLIALVIIIQPLLILSFSALSLMTSDGLLGISNSGYHGLSQILYEFASASANNGSGFEGLVDNTLFYNITTALVMFIGRYVTIILELAIAGSLMKKSIVSNNGSALSTNNYSFSMVIVVVVYVLAGLTFFSVLALGPVAEHLSMFF